MTKRISLICSVLLITLGAWAADQASTSIAPPATNKRSGKPESFVFQGMRSAIAPDKIYVYEVLDVVKDAKGKEIFRANFAIDALTLGMKLTTGQSDPPTLEFHGTAKKVSYQESQSKNDKLPIMPESFTFESFIAENGPDRKSISVKNDGKGDWTSALRAHVFTIAELVVLGQPSLHKVQLLTGSRWVPSYSREVMSDLYVLKLRAINQDGGAVIDVELADRDASLNKDWEGTITLAADGSLREIVLKSGNANLKVTRLAVQVAGGR